MSRFKITIRMVKSSWFGKIAKQAGRKKMCKEEIFFRFNKQAGWKSASRVAKKSEKFKQACSSIRDFRVVCTTLIYTLHTISGLLWGLLGLRYLQFRQKQQRNLGIPKHAITLQELPNGLKSLLMEHSINTVNCFPVGSVDSVYNKYNA